MTSVSSDRRQGLNSSAAIKVPVRVASTANVPSLVGLLTIDGVVLAAGDRVLLKDQTDQTQNGIWDVDTGNWSRSLDFDGAYDALEGTVVTVLHGATYASTTWRVSTTTPSIGSAIAFVQSSLSTGDANNVQFLQAGAGAVARTMQSKERDIVSVLDFMTTAEIAAVQSNTWVAVTDVTAAVQAAMAAQTNGTVYFPPGHYRVDGTLLVDASTKPYLNLQGAGAASSIEWNGVAGTPLIYYDNGGASSFCKISDLTLENLFHTGDTILNTVVGVRVGRILGGVDGSHGTCNVTINKCILKYFETPVQVWSESDNLTFTDNYVFVWTNRAIVASFDPACVSGAGSANMRIRDNQFQGGQNGSQCIEIFNSSNVCIDNNVIQNATSGAGMILNNCTGFTITNNYTESTSGDRFIYCVGSKVGYIGSNQMGGYDALAHLIDIDVNCRDINIGPNYIVTSGAPVTNGIRIAAGALGINILAEQYLSGAAPSGGMISGSPNVNLAYTSDAAFAQNMLAPKLRTYHGTTVLGAASFATLFTADNGAGGSCYIVHSTQGAESYSATALVTVPEGAAAAVISDWGHTNANFTLSVSGLDVRLNNGIAGARTGDTTWLRLQ